MSTRTAAVASDAPTTAPTPWTGVRVQPTLLVGLLLYVGYLAVFFTVWTVNDVDYDTIGTTVESTRLHYAMPTLLGSAFLAVALTALGWWRITLFDRSRSGPWWAWIGPLAMAALIVSAFSTMHTDEVTAELVTWSVLGAIGVGFGEEMATRGALLVGLRATRPEQTAWLLSTLAFAAVHAPNALFGQTVGKTAVQLVLTFVLGSLLWASRRLSGTLLVPILLHGAWDSSIFLPDATGADPFAPMLLIYPLAIVVTIAVRRRNRGRFVR